MPRWTKLNVCTTCLWQLQLTFETKIHTSADQLLSSELYTICAYDAQSGCCHLFSHWSLGKKREQQSQTVQRMHFHVDNWLTFLAHLLRDILTAKFQSEQFLPTASKKFWINSLLNSFSLYSSFPFSSSQCILDSAPRITQVCSTQIIPALIKGIDLSLDLSSLDLSLLPIFWNIAQG